MNIIRRFFRWWLCKGNPDKVIQYQAVYQFNLHPSDFRLLREAMIIKEIIGDSEKEYILDTSWNRTIF